MTSWQAAPPALQREVDEALILDSMRGGDAEGWRAAGPRAPLWPSPLSQGQQEFMDGGKVHPQI